jgi:hypothetical protein
MMTLYSDSVGSVRVSRTRQPSVMNLILVEGTVLSKKRILKPTSCPRTVPCHSNHTRGPGQRQRGTKQPTHACAGVHMRTTDGAQCGGGGIAWREVTEACRPPVLAPTQAPTVSSDTRRATDWAATRRGCVTPIRLPPSQKPPSSKYWGNWVVLPDDWAPPQTAQQQQQACLMRHHHLHLHHYHHHQPNPTSVYASGAGTLRGPFPSSWYLTPSRPHR